MAAPRAATTNGQAPLVGKRASAQSELEVLRARCRRQVSVIDILGEAIAVLRAGASALKAENADLRASHQRVRDRPSARTPADAAAEDAELIEVCLPPDARAPVAARSIVARRLRDRLPAPAFDRTQLLTSELVTNSVLHSDPSAEAVLVFRLELSQRAVRLEVEGPGHRGAVAPRPPDLDGGGGFGLNLVQELSERWGLERVAAGSTRVWAQVELRPLARLPRPPRINGGALDARS
jgi:anti-sigma regulatory factor (Ser/Thr protein kinase)